MSAPNDWAKTLERNAAFKEYIKRLEALYDKKIIEITNARESAGMGKPMTPMSPEMYHGLAGEARTLKTAINLVAKEAAKKQEPADE